MNQYQADSRIADSTAFAPLPTFGVAKWADTYRRLSTNAAIPGQWRTDRVEVMRGPMNAVTESGVQKMTLMSCTQIGKSSVLENVIGYLAHFRPAPMLLVLPKEMAARGFSKERISTLISSTPALMNVFGAEGADKSGDGLQYRSFPGGFLAIEGASPTNLASRPIKILLCDEIDKYETTKEGDPIALAIERTATFQDRLVILCCSPTAEGESRIEKAYLDSDQRRAFIACPHCGEENIANFFDSEAGFVVNWEKNADGVEPRHKTSTAALYCPSCGAAMGEDQRYALLSTRGAVKWRQTKPFQCCGVEQEPLKTRKWIWNEKDEVGYAACAKCGKRGLSNEHAGFHISKLYHPQTTIRELAERWIASKDSIETRQVFLNTNLAKAFSTDAAASVDPTGLAARREVYPAQVPANCLLLTLGGDDQIGGSVNEGYLTLSVWGWGLGEESWLIDHIEIKGDPFQPRLWRQLDEYLMREWHHESGRRMRIQAACIDSGGGNPEPVYSFCAARRGRLVWAIKGASDKGGQWAPTWPEAQIKRTRDTRFRPVLVGTNKTKDFTRQQLAIGTPGPGYVHFPDSIPQGYFDQLTAEKLRTKPFKHYFLPKGHANEALDCRVYAYAALQGWKSRGNTLERWKQKIDQVLLGPPQQATNNAVSVPRVHQPSSWLAQGR